MLSDMFIEEALERDGQSSLGSTPTGWVEKKHLMLGAVLLRTSQALGELGLSNVTRQQLGRGSFGVAYDIRLGGQKSVLKLTRDPFEFAAAVNLAGKKTAHIVHVHGIWAAQCSFAREHWVPWYVVHRSYLEPLSKRDARLINTIYDIYHHDETVDMKMPRSDRDRGMISKWSSILTEELAEPHWSSDEGHMVIRRDLLARALQLVMQIGAAVREMHGFGVDWADFHSKNLMRDEKGALRISDFGWGTMHHDDVKEVPWFTTEVAREHAARWMAS